jgi:hypothetical protein
MIKALVVKELREAAGLVALAVLATAYALAELTGTRLVPWQNNWLYGYPFIDDELAFYFWIVGCGLAIALGLRQTAWELGQNTFLFLLHRPVSRRFVFGFKLMVGISLVMLIAALMVAFYAWWEATPGHMAAPFYWSMTVPAWQMCLSLPPMYLGAFLAGIRPGRWFGSRLLPIVAGMLAAAVANSVPWVWLTVLLSFVVSGVLTAGIFYYVQSRDY